MEEEEKDDLVVKETDKNYKDRLETIKKRVLIDAKFGYKILTDRMPQNGWLVNIQPSESFDEHTKTIISVVDFYFLQDDGSRFKISYPFSPYLYVGTTPGHELQVASYLGKKYDYTVVDHVEKENLDLKNHLSGLKSKFLKVSAPSTVELMRFKKELMPQIYKNQQDLKARTNYNAFLEKHLGSHTKENLREACQEIIDIREYDLPYHMRVCIDEKYFVGLWYTVIGRDVNTQRPIITRNEDLIDQPDPVVLAFDIETTKLPLKFPDSEFDEIMMISYMIDGLGYLIINRQIVSEDIEDFEYTPKPEFKGEFTVFNEEDERAVIQRFFQHILRVKPSIITTYNGDFFDWPFVDARAKHHGISMEYEIGFFKDSQDEYKHNNCIHMDAFRWVKRDSYLPMGSQNLKATTKAKLRYDPIELDPELMCEMARHQPQTLAKYSVSDAVATYYLYMKYVHPFIFALCTIIPLGPDDVLRKGSGTLCEALLMVQAFDANIIFPNKQLPKDNRMSSDGHMIESETYVGGHVEALESGVFRADIPCQFRLDVEQLHELKVEVRQTLAHTLTVEMDVDLNDVTNFDEAVRQVESELDELADIPKRLENPKIYHLDVGAMYPNIILTNRLQPPAVITEENCMACVYNTEDAKCKREMNWMWRGDLIPATKGEYEPLLQQLEQERFGGKPFHSLPRDEQTRLKKKRIQDYCKKAHGKIHVSRQEERTTTICQRENAFYVNTVLAFRDRRYDYKALLKKAKGELDAVSKNNISELKSAQARVVLYESLQLAHKCILNSFYGYVMRKGSRWFSMEMAGIVCYTGANIIKEARELIEKIGRPLELDTDGIWCLLPASFPENITFTTKKKKPITISYPGAMLNALVKDKFTNDQYHNLQSDRTYTVTHENSIFFEVDGPYLAMILPASKEEGKKLKKRYAVFNFDGSLAELKGFEVKRRGELGIIKEFQTTIFKAFLKGTTLSEVYESVAAEADYWLDHLYEAKKGMGLPDDELFNLISENRSMSKKLEEYGAQKSTSITTAKRLAEFLGEDMVKNAGLACSYVIGRFPLDAPVAERAIPLAIFKADPKIRLHFVKKWTKQQNMTIEKINIHELLDWEYYIERLGSCIQKIITIPAIYQGVSNPVKRIKNPDWLENKIRQRANMINQPKINSFFKGSNTTSKTPKKTPNKTPSRKRFQTPLNKIIDSIEIVATPSASAKRSCIDSVNVDIVLDIVTISHADKENLRPTNQKATNSQAKRVVSQEKKSLNRHGFDAWYGFIKKKWDKLHADRKANRSFGDNRRGMTRLQQMVASNRDRMRSEVWHLLQIVETKTAGIYNVFALVDGALRRFSLKVPRIFYVDDFYPRETQAGKAVQKVLPKMKPSFNLYEYSVDETQFAAKINELNRELCSLRINGIYETQVPLLFRALIQLGCSCKIGAMSSNSMLTLNQIEMMPTNKTDYVDLQMIRLFYFYEFSRLSRDVLGLFSPSIQRGYIIIVNKTRVDLANIMSLYKTEFQKFINRRGPDILDPQCENTIVEAIQCTTVKEASRQIQNILKGLKLPPTDPTLFCVQSQKLSEELYETFPFLAGYPIVPIRAAEPATLMNVLDWANMMAKRVIQHFFNSFIYLNDYWTIAPYVGIPVGNIPEDISILALDVFFARALQKNNYLLWASSSSRPDFGGKESDDYRLTADWETSAFKQHNGRIYNLELFEPNKIVVELELGAVAVTALIHSARILEAEGTSDFVGFASGVPIASVDTLVAAHRSSTTHFDEAASVSGAIRVLKQIFRDLIKDIHTQENVLADQFVASLHRWLCDPNSLLYNPSICTAISILMKKLCLLLVSEINQVGAKVMFCSFTRLIISTNRSDMKAAKAFTSSLISSLTQNTIFAALHLNPENFWNMCLWVDSNNFATIKYAEDAEEEDEVSMNFSMSDMFPPNSGCKDALDQVTAGYMALLAKKIREPSTDEELVEYSNKLLSDELNMQLFKIVTKLCEMKKQGLFECDNNSEQLTIDIPLEFVKCICKILSLDMSISEGLDRLRGQLFQVLQKDEMSSESFWNAPTIICILENIFCTQCNQVVDLDVGMASTSEEKTFNCSSCQAAIPTNFVEEMLINRISKMTTAFALQDYKCRRCKQISTRFLTGYCECSSEMEMSIRPNEFISNLKAVKKISQIHSLSILEYTISSVLQTYGFDIR